MNRELHNIGRFTVSVVEEGEFSCTAGIAAAKQKCAQGAADSDVSAGFFAYCKKLISVLIAWWCGVNNLDDYRKYLTHQKIHHPGSPVLSEAEFWRRKWDSDDTKPQARCC